MLFLKHLKIYIATLGILTLFFEGVFIASVNAAEISSIRLSQTSEKSRIVFDINGAIDYKVFQLDNPRRLVVDVANISKKPSLSHLKIKDLSLIHI